MVEQTYALLFPHDTILQGIQVLAAGLVTLFLAVPIAFMCYVTQHKFLILRTTSLYALPDDKKTNKKKASGLEICLLPVPITCKRNMTNHKFLS